MSALDFSNIFLPASLSAPSSVVEVSTPLSVPGSAFTGASIQSALDYLTLLRGGETTFLDDIQAQIAGGGTAALPGTPPAESLIIAYKSKDTLAGVTIETGTPGILSDLPLDPFTQLSSSGDPINVSLKTRFPDLVTRADAPEYVGEFRTADQVGYLVTGFKYFYFKSAAFGPSSTPGTVTEETYVLMVTKQV